jgi:pantoate--beta-alanine ligase
MTSARAFVALGSNLGQPAERLDAACRALAETPGLTLVATSTYHETRALGGPPDQPDYHNAVCELESELGPRELLACLLEIERAEGRERASEERWGARRLDLDLLFFGSERIASDELQLPHPRLEERIFVLAPLCELAPERVLAGCGLSVRERLRELRAPGRLARLDSVGAAREWCRAVRAEGRSLGFVATMGALHEGHLALVRRALAENDAVCVSVFVNPLQFDEAGDLANYPRDFAGDAALLAQARVDMVFQGTLEQFFEGQLDGEGSLQSQYILDPGPCAVGLEGAYREGHFAGVATIVARLFEVIEPERAYFGQKDYQQARVVMDLARKLGRPAVVVCPTVREASGLALSSRNERLSRDQRAKAAGLSRALFATAEAWRAGERGVAALGAVLRSGLEPTGLEIEYAALRSLEKWTHEEPTGDLQAGVALVAARVGPVRLIDSFILSDPVPSAHAPES